MAACGSLQHIFEPQLPEIPATLLDSFSSSWNRIQPIKPNSPFDHLPHHNQSSFTEIFGELHFKEKTPSGSNEEKKANHYPSSSASSFESLQLCTEGLGFESLDDDIKGEEMMMMMNEKKCRENKEEEKLVNHRVSKRSRRCWGAFPPPISCIGRSGKPWICFQSYRIDGRFVLKEVRVPSQEVLQSCRENGRLKMQFIQTTDDGILDEEEEEEEEEAANEDDHNGEIEEKDEEVVRKQI